MSRSRYKTCLVLIWAIGCILLLAIAWGRVSQWQMGDPDDQLRLVQIRDWLAGQSWWDVTQYRMNPPFGGPMHWSRLVDVPIAGSILMLTPILGRALAEHATAVAIPLLTFGIVIALTASLANRLIDRKAALVAAISLFAIIPVVVQLAPMRIDHHGWQLVLFLAATRALFAERRLNLAAVAIGVCTALWIEISIEGLPYAALFLALLGLRWLLGPPQHLRQFPIAALSLAAGSTIFFIMTEGFYQPNYCDSLSPVHIWIFAAVATLIASVSYIVERFEDKVGLGIKIAGGLIAAGIATAIMGSATPHCMSDAFAELDPVVREYWYNRTPEGLPLWEFNLAWAVYEIFGILVGLIGLSHYLIKTNLLGRLDKWLLGLIYAGTAGIALTVARANIYPLVLAAILNAGAIVWLFSSRNDHLHLGIRLPIRLAAIAFIVPSLIGLQLSAALETTGNPPSPAEAKAEDDFLKLALKCQSANFIRKLNRLPPAQLMVGLDVSPALLQFTHHRVVATGHHRNQHAMRDVIRSYIGSVDEMRQVLKARNIDYLVACDGSFELQVYQSNVPKGFWNRLKSGERFSWLEPQPDIGVYQVWRVNHKALAR
ncbi:MAG: hypothetical protein ACRCY3_04535 [Sphingorhabdus sp.]